MTPVASVITPVYRTPLPLFKEAYESLLAQSIGFDHIEWLVAVHNMDDDYIRELKKIAGGNAVFLKAEGGDSPSVPRNMCLEHASGRYVFFLDSDDRLAADCVEKTVDAMEKTGAEMAVFGCELFGNTIGYGRYRLKAPDEEVVLYGRGDNRIDELMSEWGGTLWSRAYRRSFLMRTGARLDERVRAGEDLRFNMKMSGLAGSVAALPRLTGCYHRMQPDSLLEKERGGEKGLKLMAELMRDARIYGSSQLQWEYLCGLVRIALKSGLRRSDVTGAVSPELSHLRVIAPRFSWTRERTKAMLDLCGAMFTIPCSPRLRQRFEITESVISPEELTDRVAAAAEENPELRTIGVEGQYLGVARDDARPETAAEDLRALNDYEREAVLAGRQREELERGFRDGEVRCRVTLLRLTSLRCAVCVTWDERFVGERSVARMLDLTRGELGSYDPCYPSIGEMLRRQAALRPESAVFRYWDGKGLALVTRRELEEQTEALGAFLAAEGLSRIAIAGQTSYNWVLLYLAALRAGQSVVALEAGLVPEEMARRLQLAKAEAVFLDDGLYAEGFRSFRLSDLPALTQRGRVTAGSIYTDHNDGEQVNMSDTALILFTSGTTGYGKAAVLTHGNLIASARCTAARATWYERRAICLPLSHIATHQLLLCAMYTGAEILLTNVQPTELIRDMRLFEPQNIALVPRQLQLLLASLIGTGKDPCSKLREINCGGASYPEALAGVFEKRGIRVMNFYGSTETTGVLAATPHGKSRRGTELELMPETRMRPGEGGELQIRSPMVFAGYLNDTEATAQVLDEDGWFRTGDLYRSDTEDGTFVITGRLKNLILFSNGENVSPEELESFIMDDEMVEECLVFGEKGEKIAVRIYPAEEARKIEPEALREALWTKIAALNAVKPRYMRIEKLYISDRPLDRNSMGKLKRP